MDIKLIICSRTLLALLLYISNAFAEQGNGTNDIYGRTYKGLVLENGLKVILVSDPSTTFEAASLNVAVGAMSDPKELQGLAHLLEHVILVRGNMKYPEPDEFANYVHLNGGYRGASTYMDYARYFFSVYPNALEGSLDRLFHTVHSPLLSESSIKAEIDLVSSENAIYASQDVRRLVRLDQYTSREGHPFNTFGTGSRDSLWDKPRELGLDLRNETVQFYKKYYSANLMTLAVVGKDNLTTLEDIVTRIFRPLENRNATLPSFGPPYGPSELGVKIEMVAKGQMKRLSMVFPIPAMDKNVFEIYIANVVTQGGNHSLLSFLRLEGLITSSSAEVNKKCRGHFVFQVILDLTDLGVLRHEEVAVKVFQFFNLLRNHPPQKWFWDEVEEIKNYTTKYQTKVEAVELAALLGKSMIESTPDDVVEEYLSPKRTQFNATQIVESLEWIRPGNMRLFFVSNSIKNASSTEPHYQFKYNSGPFESKFLTAMKTIEVHPNIIFPTRNIFVPKDFAMKQNVSDSVFESTNFSSMWIYTNDENNSPKVDVRIELFSTYTPYVTPQDIGMNSILAVLLKTRLLPMGLKAIAAGTSIKISNDDSGLKIRVEGYTDGFTLIVTELMHTIYSLSFTRYDFDIAKKTYVSSIKENLNAEPCTLANTGILLAETYFEQDMILYALNDLSLEDFELFYRRFVSRPSLYWRFFGGIQKWEAIALVQTSEALLLKRGSRPGQSFKQSIEKRVVEIPRGTSWLYRISSEIHSSSCTKVVFQAGSKTKDQGDKLALLSDLMHHPLNVQLYTKERLGYLVGIVDTSITLQLYVQGERDTKFMERRINNFLHKFRGMLKNMTQEELDLRMLTLMERFIIIGNETKIDELQKFYDELIGFTPGEYRRLSIHVSPEVPSATEEVENIPADETPAQANVANITKFGSMTKANQTVTTELEVQVDKGLSIADLTNGIPTDEILVIGLNQTTVEIISLASWNLDCYLRPV
ncbi:insulin-degrading enzyme isoform X3 [Folsomia candida]|nr:insulin-degrading enzyme isoform X3 [Folsomia candida]